MSFNIYHNLIIRATLNQVFNAVSQPEHLNNWWTLKSSGTPVLNQEYNLNFTNDYDWYCKVSEVKPNESIRFKMTKSDKDWGPTTFGFELVDTENETQLRFSHTNWQNQNDHFKSTSYCWAMLLNGLKNYLEKGIVIPYEERN